MLFAMNLQDLVIYQNAMTIAEEIWNIVISWEYFAKNSLGRQWVNAVDSIGQNIAEGYGRYHFRDAKNFYYYARGSLFESLSILRKASNRKLVTCEAFDKLQKEHKDLIIRLNNFITKVGPMNQS